MSEDKKIATKVLDKVEEALEERQETDDRRVFSMDLPKELERRSGQDRRKQSGAE